jgi:RND family efflux transporter MFP subunit
MRHRTYSYIALAALVLALGSVACRPAAEAEEGAHAEHAALPESVTLTPEAVRTAGIGVAEAELMPVVRHLRVTGEVSLDPKRKAHVTARTSGRAEKLSAYPGDRVREGQVLLAIYSPDFLMLQSELLLAAGRSARPAADAAERAASESLAASIRDRLRAFGLADADIAGVEKAGAALPLLPVRAPMTGTVVESALTAGDQVEVGTSLFRLADLSRVRAVLRVYEKDLAVVGVGAEAVITAASAPGREFKGRISRIGNTVDPGTRTVEAWVDLADPAGELRQGLYLEADIDLPAGTEAVFVPEAAVLDIAERKVVFVLTGENVFALREVKLGPAGAGRVQIASGLAAKEVVAAAGSFFIKSELLKGSFGEDEHGHD